jgi:hypothetical protein
MEYEEGKDCMLDVRGEGQRSGEQVRMLRFGGMVRVVMFRRSRVKMITGLHMDNLR